MVCQSAGFKSVGYCAFSPATAGFMASIPVLASIPALLVVPRVVPSHLRGQSLALMGLLLAAGIMLAVNTSVFPLLVVGLVLVGICNQCLATLILLMLMDSSEVGAQYLGFAGGMFFSFSQIGGFAAPFIMGILIDMTGAFMAGGAFLASLGIVIFAVAFLLKATPASKR